MGKLLSVIMPTYNRAWMITYSLDLIKDQIIRNAEDVELIVCNDASSDNTADVINEYMADNHFFRFVNYTTYAEVGINISRSIDNASGKYFLLWGDDDVPCPGMIDVYVEVLKRHGDLDCIYSNRLQAYPSDGNELREMHVFDKQFVKQEVIFDNSEEFIKTCYKGMTFLSVDLLSMSAWKKGRHLYNEGHFGFEYLAPFLYGISGTKCLYLNYPMCIQRHLEVPRYIDKWPLYLYVGIPRVLKQMEGLGVLTNWEATYKQYHYNVSNDDFIYHFIRRCLPNKKMYLPYIDEIIEYQKSIERKCVAKAFRLPSILFVLLCMVIPMPRKIKEGLLYLMDTVKKVFRRVNRLFHLFRG